MKNLLKLLAFGLSLLTLLSLFTCCKRSDGSIEVEEPETYGDMPELDTSKLESYIKPFVYSGLVIPLGDSASASEALWRYISENAEVIAYPEPQVEYYASEERAKYRYYASRDGIEYEALLSELGISEADIYASARSLVKDDLVLAYIVKSESISLSDGEYASHVDRYAERLCSVYGYDAEYIKANMSKQLRSSMLYDKTMEYLLLNNTVE